MALKSPDIFFGKLAIGRRYLSREEALKLAHEVEKAARGGRHETLQQAALRLGYLDKKKTDELLHTIRDGSLVCRGSCAQTYPLSSLSPHQTTACPGCQGPLYVVREAVRAAVEDEGKGGMTLMELETPDLTEAPPPPDFSLEGGAPQPDFSLEKAGTTGSTFMDLDLDAPPDPPTGPPPEARGTAPTEAASPAGALAPGVTDYGRIPSPVPIPKTARQANPPSALSAPTPGGSERTAQLDDPLVDAESTAEFSELGTTWRGDPAALAFEPFTVGGKLEILAPIGKGGMGSVFRARRKADGEIVAIKILSQTAVLSPDIQLDILTRFRREIKLSSGLKHPSIVRVYESGVIEEPGEHQGRPYFTMDYVPGRDLAAWLDERPRSQADMVKIMSPVCEAMNYAHGRGVVHRDLKPANVLVRAPDEAPMVCDFGLAKYHAETHNLTRTGDILGTPSYMPPEQALGQRTKIGPPTDVYALGAILYFLLVGRPPFSAPSAFAVIEKVVKKPPEPPTSLNPSVDPGMEQVVLKALAKSPVERYHTCAQLKDALLALDLPS